MTKADPFGVQLSLGTATPCSETPPQDVRKDVTECLPEKNPYRLVGQMSTTLTQPQDDKELVQRSTSSGFEDELRDKLSSSAP